MVMPRKPPHPCAYRRCPNLTHEQYCDEHRGEGYKRDKATRGTAADRGYDSRWKRRRDAYLRQHPLCEECGRPAKVVDHIKSKRHGGKDVWSNFQSLCTRCHNRKTRRGE